MLRFTIIFYKYYIVCQSIFENILQMYYSEIQQELFRDEQKKKRERRGRNRTIGVNLEERNISTW